MASFTDPDAIKLQALNAQPYKEQAITFLNAFWEAGPNFKKHPDLCEELWQLKERIVKLDKRGEAGNEVDEFTAHRLLEQTQHTLTVQEMRKTLAAIDLIPDKCFTLTEFLVYKYNVNWHALVNAPKNDSEKIIAAQGKVNKAQKQLQAAADAEVDAQNELQASIDAEKKAKEEEATSIEREKQAKIAEEEVISAKEASEASLKAVEQQEKEYRAAVDELEGKAYDESLSTVKRNTAKAQLAAVKSEDPMPLRKAKIGQEAAVRRMNKAVKSASAQTAAAAAAYTSAVAARKEAERLIITSTKAAEHSVQARADSEVALQEAQDFLEVTRAQCSGTSAGSLWAVERELQEAMKYMSKAQQARLTAQREAAAREEEALYGLSNLTITSPKPF